MESNYRNSDFEQYVKENADQYRMFPSEKVWKGINSTLHTRRKWYGAGLALLLLMTGAAVTWVMVSYPVSKNQPVVAAKMNSAATSNQTSSVETSPEIINKVLPFSNTNSVQKKSLASQAEPGNTPSFILIDEPVRLVANVVIPDQPAFVRNEKNQLFPLLAHQKAPVIAHEINTSSYYDLDEPTNESSIVRRRNSVEMPHSDRPSHFTELDYPLTESIADAYLPKKPAKKISWQIFVTPTISYRKLGNNKTADNAATTGFPFSTTTDVNKAVTHKPDMGLQIGVSARYPVTKNLKIRGGLQFNINRYDIKAFAYNPEIATINLTDPSGNNINSVSTWAYYRTRSGYKSDWLKNYYFSISAPIGAELTLFGNKKTSIGFAGTIQPTYIIKDRAYLLSSDYKNYAKVPSLIRHVNVNTGFETFVNYTSGKTKWQIGPQVRYQVLSSFRNKYPVKENLFDFGIKLGVTLNE